jgi:hypothetical protein
MSEKVRLQRPASWSDEIDRDELLDLYMMLIEEYRFQVKLNSDRTQIYLVLNAAILTAATGLLKVGGPSTRTLVFLIFVLGVFVAWIAARTVEQGHFYYRSIVYKKTLVEHLLGRHRQIDGYSHKGATLAIETTAGMSRDSQILDDSEAWVSRSVKIKTVTGGLIVVFRIVAIVDALAATFIAAIAARELYRAW